MDMTKEAITEIKNLGTTADGKRIIDHGGKTFLVNGSEVEQFIPDDQPRTLEVSTLSAVVQYIQFQHEVDQPLFIHIVSPREVELLTALDAYGRRKTLVRAGVVTQAPDVDKFMDAETLNIELQTRFAPEGDRDVLLKLVGNIKDEVVKKYGDDGVSQKVTIQTGTATVGEAEVPRTVTLTPYRTFPDIEQLPADYIFRMRDGGKGAFIELTNGSWQLTAMNAIATYFVENLSEDDAIDNSNVSIIG